MMYIKVSNQTLFKLRQPRYFYQVYDLIAFTSLKSMYYVIFKLIFCINLIPMSLDVPRWLLLFLLSHIMMRLMISSDFYIYTIKIGFPKKTRYDIIGNFYVKYPFWVGGSMGVHFFYEINGVFSNLITCFTNLQSG